MQKLVTRDDPSPSLAIDFPSGLASSMKRSNSLSVLNAQFQREQSLISNLMGLRGRTTSIEFIRPSPAAAAANVT
ncbi:hypothetical protein DAPPUDRAFT_314541 [Daphnia pulex]|uniref:Uncharacterized protein n=2 Tax=Daphnia TaxID=6668 RepID=E9G6H6_DAPPU|nr:hypothetical protein DAPPUDRAFT_314541 [Daphnia pulex]|eukprot:EFX84938.1 hypothetical protein DAPPUDRAFT_314541 [Daphnia pulex]